MSRGRRRAAALRRTHDQRPHAPLIDGRVGRARLALTVSGLPIGELFWRQLKFADFDVSEMSISSLAIATSRAPTDWVALPVFTMRLVLPHRDPGPRRRRDRVSRPTCAGKRVGVLEYQQTVGRLDPGLARARVRDPRAGHGVVHAARARAQPRRLDRLPAARRRAALRTSRRRRTIGEMIVARRARRAAVLSADPATISIDRSQPRPRARSARPAALPRRRGRSAPLLRADGDLPGEPLRGRAARARRSRSGDRARIAGTPSSRRTRSRAARRSLAAPAADVGLLDAATGTALAADPLAYGVKANRPTLDALLAYIHEQGLRSRRVAIDELFAAPILDR